MGSTRNNEEVIKRRSMKLALRHYRSAFLKDIEGFVLANRITPERLANISYADGEWVIWYWGVG